MQEVTFEHEIAQALIFLRVHNNKHRVDVVRLPRCEELEREREREGENQIKNGKRGQTWSNRPSVKSTKASA
jgi:hypothetical protein